MSIKYGAGFIAHYIHSDIVGHCRVRVQCVESSGLSLLEEDRDVELCLRLLVREVLRRKGQLVTGSAMQDCHLDQQKCYPDGVLCPRY